MADYLTDAFIRLRQRLKWVSGRILPDADGVEDVLQDSFVRLWRRKYPLKSEREAEALLIRTVRNHVLPDNVSILLHIIVIIFLWDIERISPYTVIS